MSLPPFLSVTYLCYPNHILFHLDLLLAWASLSNHLCVNYEWREGLCRFNPYLVWCEEAKFCEFSENEWLTDKDQSLAYFFFLFMAWQQLQAIKWVICLGKMNWINSTKVSSLILKILKQIKESSKQHLNGHILTFFSIIIHLPTNLITILQIFVSANVSHFSANK